MPEGFDVAILGFILLNWPASTHESLFDKAFKSLNKGGSLLIYDWFKDESYQNMDAYALSLNMTLTEKGYEP